MSGDDDLRARYVALSVWSNTCNAYCSEEDATHAPECILAAGAYHDLATPAEPARESDGVGLREEEREALVEAFRSSSRSPDHLAFLATPTVEKLIAARVAEAGARALEDLVEAIKVRRAEPDDFGRQGRARYTAGLSWAADRAKERAEELREAVMKTRCLFIGPLRIRWTGDDFQPLYSERNGLRRWLRIGRLGIRWDR